MNINIGWPEGILLTLLILGTFVRYTDLGKPRPADKWWSPLLNLFLMLYLLQWGGFFS